MDSQECRANALKCCRLAHGLASTQLRQDLLKLMVQWRELAVQIEKLKPPRPSGEASIGGGLFNSS